MFNCDEDALIITDVENDNSILEYLDNNLVNLYLMITSSDAIGVVKCY